MTPRKETTAAILARLDQRLAHIDTTLSRIAANYADHERRIRSLETYKTWLIGATASMGAGLTALIVWLKGDK